MERAVRTQKLSPVMALLMGILVTLEIMVAGTMILRIDVRTADVISILFVFIMLYCGVVAFLTDK
ncbi:MAG: hypothetical protein KBT01_06340 [Clostridiales bacterium]|nr:hypothetical protein [Candidatus Blautia equi]